MQWNFLKRELSRGQIWQYFMSYHKKLSLRNSPNSEDLGQPVSLVSILGAVKLLESVKLHAGISDREDGIATLLSK